MWICLRIHRKSHYVLKTEELNCFSTPKLRIGFTDLREA